MTWQNPINCISKLSQNSKKKSKHWNHCMLNMVASRKWSTHYNKLLKHFLSRIWHNYMIKYYMEAQSIIIKYYMIKYCKNTDLISLQLLVITKNLLTGSLFAKADTRDRDYYLQSHLSNFKCCHAKSKIEVARGKAFACQCTNVKCVFKIPIRYFNDQSGGGFNKIWKWIMCICEWILSFKSAISDAEYYSIHAYTKTNQNESWNIY